MSRQLIVEMIAKTDKFKGPMGDVNKQTESFGTKIKNASRVAGPAIAGIGAAWAALAAPLEEAEAKLGQIVANSEAVTEINVAQWADDNRRSFQMSGISIADQNDALSEAIGLGHNWGDTVRIMSVANDLAAATGIDLKTAVEQIGRSADGSGKLVDKFGLEGENLSGILTELDSKVGGVSAEMDKTFANKMRGYITVVKDFAASHGELAPLVTATGIAITALGPAINAARVAMQGLNVVIRKSPVYTVGAVMIGIAEASERLTGGFDGVKDSLFNLNNQVSQITDRFRDLWRWITNVADAVGRIPGSILGAGGGAIGSIGSFFGGLFHEGGVVPGRPGQNVPILAQAGETVVPRGGGGGVTINVSGVGMGRDFGQVIADALRDNDLIGAS